MTSPGHPEIGPELRALMQTILDRIDPLVSAAAAAVTADTLRSPGPASRCGVRSVRWPHWQTANSTRC